MDFLSRKQRLLTPLLFLPSTPISTVSPIYQSLHNSKTFKEKNPNLEQHSDYLIRKNFSIDDTEMIMQDSLVCKPSNFGYTLENGEYVFPKYKYPSCKEANSYPVPEIAFNFKDNTITIECKHSNSWYVLEPRQTQNRLYQFSEIRPHLISQEFSKPIKLTTEEFIFASCDKSHYTSALYLPRFNSTVYTKTSEKMNQLKQKHRPLIVLILTVDSFSRRHFFRKLVKTVDYLNKLHKNFTAFDFKLHNIFGSSSVENMVPIFSDIPYQEVDIPREYDVHKNDSMWKHFREKGFVTLFGLEDCDYYFPNALGRKLEVDHIIRNFYCVAKEYTNLDTEVTSKMTQRCVGQHMSHWYTLNYTHEFSKLYSGLNQWIYLHINTAHEATGQHAGTLDDDLFTFLKQYLSYFSPNHEIALFLQADHGMRYGNWFQDIEGYQENKLPVFFLIASSSLLDRIPESYDKLITNTLRLTTKKDLRPTINYLADLPYMVPSNVFKSKFINLFTQTASLNRTCEEIEISPFDCSCLVVEELPEFEKDKDLLNLVHTIIQEALYKMNAAVHTPYIGDFNLCQKLSFRNIINVYGLMLNNKVEELQIKFNVNENLHAIFEIFAFVGTHKRSMVLKVGSRQSPVLNYVYRGFKCKVKIFGIKRKDKYAGVCENAARARNIKAEYCICNPEALEH